MKNILTPSRPGTGPIIRASESRKNPGKNSVPRLLLLAGIGMALISAGVFSYFKLSTSTAPSELHNAHAKQSPVAKSSPVIQDTGSLLQKRVTIYLQRYRPEGAVVAICGLRNGKLLALAERDSLGVSDIPRMALRGNFPAASLVKIITAAAYLQQGSLPTDSLPRLGKNHTLYRFQLRSPEQKDYPKISVREAFAHSINPAFGILGLKIGSGPMRIMAQRLGFNTAWPAGDVSESKFEIPDTGYGLAEASCGFTNSITLSPLHALQIARAIGDNGRIFPPMPSAGGKTSQAFLPPDILDSLKTLMAATVFQGTARKGFRRNLPGKAWDGLEMGGKTGSLDGQNPPGRYEWYIGYAHLKESPDLGIAVAVMFINRTVIAVHAAEFAALLVRDWERSALRISYARR